MDLRRTILRDDRISLLQSALALAKKTKEDGMLNKFKEDVAQNTKSIAPELGTQVSTNELIKRSLRIAKAPGAVPATASSH